MTEVYMFFYQSVLPTFTHLNLLLQREDPNIYLVADAIRTFLKKLLSKFVKLPVITTANVTEIDFSNSDNQLANCSITVGIVTRQLLNKLFNDGDISENDKKKVL